MTNPFPPSFTRPACLAAAWAIPALASATALTAGGHSVLRSLILVILLVSATLATALLPALQARRSSLAGPLSPGEAAALTAAAMASGSLSLATISLWAGGAATPHWFVCLIILTAASMVIIRHRNPGHEDTRETEPAAYPPTLD